MAEPSDADASLLAPGDPALTPAAWIDRQARAALALLPELSAINSGSFNVAGVDAVGARIEALLAPLAGPMQRIDLAPTGAPTTAAAGSRRPSARRGASGCGRRHRCRSCCAAISTPCSAPSIRSSPPAGSMATP